MTAKSINITYWVCTIIFAILMIYSSIGGLQPNKETIAMIHDQLGYPIYFIQFISIAKIVGSIVILIPGLGRSIKEWAYAGLFFDLAGAAYSGISASTTFDPRILGMLIWFIAGILSYYFWRKKTSL